MKKTLLSLALVAAAICSAKAPERTVYYCDSKTSYAYHLDRNCSELKYCKHDVKSESEGAAKSDGRRLCKVCGN